MQGANPCLWHNLGEIMREIKVRAWDKENKAMLYPDEEQFIWYGSKIWLQVCWPYNKSRNKDVRIENLELLQFTGLKDKNGKEIFEGDIVQYTASDMSSTNIGTKSKHKIFFDNGAFLIEFPTNKGEMCGLDLRVYNQSSEIISNIYENPELLER